MRFMLLDRLTAFEPGKRGAAIKNVALSEDFFEDHFPSKPIMPGVLILEGLAQLAGLVLEEGIKRDTGRCLKALMSIVENAKFRRPAYPGDCLAYTAEVVSVNERGGKVKAAARLQDKLIAECELVFTFHEFENPMLEARRSEVLAGWLKGLEVGDVARPES